MSEAMAWDWRETGVKHPPILPEHKAEGIELPPDCQNGDAELETLWVLILRELTDKNFKNRTHGSRRTSEAGCQGPVCRKAVREHGRRRAQREASGRYRYLDPIIDFFERDALNQLEMAELSALKRLSDRF